MVETTSNSDSGVTSLCAALDNLKGKGKTKKAKAKGSTQLNQDRRDTDDDLIMKNNEDLVTRNRVLMHVLVPDPSIAIRLLCRS
jgi:hypothetical protein